MRAVDPHAPPALLPGTASLAAGARSVRGFDRLLYRVSEAFYGEESFNEEELRELSDEFEKDREEGI